GPGRFLPFAGQGAARRVALDISREMLDLIPTTWQSAGRPGPPPARVLGDARQPPLERGRWDEVIALGNPLGFSGHDANRLLGTIEDLVRPGGILLVEVA